MRITGIGARVADTLLLEIDDMHRFKTVRHLHSYCRHFPGSNDSGGKTRHKRSRDANRYLKFTLHHAAIRAIQYSPEVRAVFQQWVCRKGKAIAWALVAKELAQIVYAVLSKGEVCDGRFATITLTQTKKTAWSRQANPLG